MDKGQTIMEVSPSCDTPEAKASAGYKRTEAGVIPQDWTFGRLADLGVFRSGSGFPLVYQGLQSGDYPFFKVSDMNNQGNESFMKAANHWISEETRRKLSAIKHPIGSIAFAKIGAAIFLERKRLLSQESCIDNNMMTFELTDHRACQKFFYYLFLRIELGKLVSTTALPSLSGRQIGAINVPTPPFEEQRAVAEVLSDIDKLLASLDALIYKKRAIKQATMQQLLTGRIRLPSFNGEWEVKRLDEIGRISGAGVDKKIEKAEILVRLVNYLDVYNKTFLYSKDLTHEVSAKQNQLRRCRIEKGDIFFTPTSEVRDDIGCSAVAMEDILDGVYSYHVVRLRLHVDWDLRFRGYVFNTKSFRDSASKSCEGSGTRYVITLAKFRAMTVHFPPNRREQHAIADILSDMDAEIAALERRQAKACAIKEGMMQRLLTGWIRLPRPE